MKTHYDVLEVAETASTETIAAAYRSLCKRYHPDVSPHRASATDHMKEINHAYEVLSDSAKRQQYDAHLQSQRRNHGAQPPPRQLQDAHMSESRASSVFSARRVTAAFIVLGIGVFLLTDIYGTHNLPSFQVGEHIMPTGSTDPSKILRVVAVSQDTYKVFTHMLVNGRLIVAEDYQARPCDAIDKSYVKVARPDTDGTFSPDKFLSEH